MSSFARVICNLEILEAKTLNQFTYLELVLGSMAFYLVVYVYVNNLYSAVFVYFD